MTPWFNKYTRPHWIGVYETRAAQWDAEFLFNYWNGDRWGMCGDSPENALFMRNISTYIQNIEWRGFTKEQK